MGEGFWSGFVAGMIAALFLGMVGRFINRLLAIIRAPNKPQSVSLETKKTPAQVIAEANAAIVRLVVTLFLLGLVTFLGARLVSYLLGNA